MEAKRLKAFRKELASQFSSVAQMQSQMQNLDGYLSGAGSSTMRRGQMEIVTGLIHRMATRSEDKEDTYDI